MLRTAVNTPREFYASASVRRRLAEYCGGTSADPGSFTAEFLSGVGETLELDPFSGEYFVSASAGSFSWLLEQGADVFRAVWDRSSAIGVLDMEYFSLVYPAEAYLNAGAVFKSIEPVYDRIRKLFGRFCIPALPIMTGQGYHFSFRVGKQSAAYARLAALGHISPTLAGKYGSPAGQRTRPVPPAAGLAFDGMGRVMEYFAHLLLRDLGTGYRGMPVVCTDLAAGGPREAIALDLSMYADPLFTRDIRCPFSTYQKHKVLHRKFGYRAAKEVPVLVTLPRFDGEQLSSLLDMRTDLARCQRFAAAVETEIPEASGGFARLLRSYLSSGLRRFHEDFDAVGHDDPARWPETYDRLELEKIPPCVACCLRAPNDNILKPTNIQALTRVLMALSWHPKHVAGLIRSKLERDYGWGTQWFRYDAATRANCYVRLFAGLIACGVDSEDDLNCISHTERGYCIKPNCGFNLAHYKLSRRPRAKAWGVT